MLVLLSPAKSLDWSAVSPPSHSTPELAKEAKALAGVMKSKTAPDIASLMKLSEKLSLLNYERFQSMTSAPDPERDRPAAMAFDGDVYRGLDARTLSPEDLEWAQDHLAILSGLYGVLRPLDLIEPYRLEMGTRLTTKRGVSLYDYWGESVTKIVEERVAATKSNVIVNLASQEYSRAVRLKTLESQVITPVFQEISENKHKVISFFAKRARGAMARFIVQNRIETVESLKDFTGGGYRYDAGLSSEVTWVFARPKPPPAK